MNDMNDTTFDIAVIGSGAGGLSAAVFAALNGARVIVIESTEYVGGTSALSAATAWVPGTRLATDVGSHDTIEDARRYLDNAVGNKSSSALRDAFLQNGPLAIHALLDQTDVQMRARPFHPDYLAEIDGSTTKGRAIEPIPFDARPLGRDLALIRPPIPEFTILGGLMVDRDDISHLLKMTKSFTSFWYAAKLLGGYMKDRILRGRSSRLVMGNALIGRLLLSARKLGVAIRTKTQIVGIKRAETGFVITHDTGAINVSKAVILATGGFGRHPTLRNNMVPKDAQSQSPAAPGHTGVLHDIVRTLGGVYGTGNDTHVFMAPVSKRQRDDGSMAVFPHFVFDRSKPGIISVDANGRRFTNEARSYHEFAKAQLATGTTPAFLITDARGLRKYGLGMVRPGARGAKSLIRAGYLFQAPSLSELARTLDIDMQGLIETVQRMNTFADLGQDADFGRGATVYECGNGDPMHGPNPTLGRLDEAPFYAVKLYPADIGSCTGFSTNENAEILDGAGRPLGGIYACGNDMQSIMGDVYTGPGITIGPAITFGYVAAKHALGHGATV